MAASQKVSAAVAHKPELTAFVAAAAARSSRTVLLQQNEL
jgi:hypothetical protein